MLTVQEKPYTLIKGSSPESLIPRNAERYRVRLQHVFD